jgi:hypothetical protein
VTAGSRGWGLAGVSLVHVPSDQIVVLDHGHELAFSPEDMLRYHGQGSPGGVAHAFKVLERALPLLERGGQVERREIVIETPFGGPGARDAFELVTRAVTEGRYTHDRSLARPEHGRSREHFVFRLRYRDRAVTLTLREGFVTDEFVELAGRKNRPADEEQRLAVLKSEMAARVMSAPAGEVYDVVGTRA